jgi:hypothetical protein
MGKRKSKLSASETIQTELAKLSEEKLWEVVNDEHSQCEVVRKTMALALQTSSAHALKLGECFTILKERTPAKTWTETVKNNCRVQIREVQRYMKIWTDRAFLDAMDAGWQEKFTLTEALEELRLQQIDASIAAAQESRTEAKEAANQRKEEASDDDSDATSTKAPAVQATASRKRKKSPALGPLKKVLTNILKAAQGVRAVILDFAKPKQLVEIEEKATAARDECDKILEACESRREELEKEESSNAKATAKSKDKSKPTAAQKSRKKAKATITTSAKGTSSKLKRKASGDPSFSGVGRV